MLGRSFSKNSIINVYAKFRDGISLRVVLGDLHKPQILHLSLVFFPSPGLVVRLLIAMLTIIFPSYRGHKFD